MTKYNRYNICFIDLSFIQYALFLIVIFKHSTVPAFSCWDVNCRAFKKYQTYLCKTVIWKNLALKKASEFPTFITIFCIEL